MNGDVRAGAQAEQRRRERLWAATAGCLLPFGLLLALVVARWRPLQDVDSRWVLRLHSTAVHRAGWAASMRTVADIGSPTVLRVLLAVVIVWLWLRGARVTALWATVLVAVEALLEVVVKELVGRPRPLLPQPVAQATGWSFPSGHAMTVATLCPLLVLLVWPHAERWGRVAAVVASTAMVLAVSWTRIGLGVHWPSDVLGGWLLAGVVLFGVAASFESLRPGLRAQDLGRLRLRSSLRVQSATAPDPASPPPE
ncbi:phosphatase PAP2 family protein [Streptacidiphilus sp. MAP12-16]|uniref:phosphatase PAP2 family protein n=1 Tax=Streptacidiphilus sp. MAP12-16 TaxID=3156300 RepID=UPI003511354E